MQWINKYFVYQQIQMRRYQKEEKSGRDIRDGNSPKSQEEDSSSPGKVTLHFPTQVQHYDEDDNTNPVSIYLRSPSKKSYKMEVPSKISMTEIKQLAEQKMSIPRDKQMLHLNGKNVTEYGYIRLQPQNIIHVTNCDDLFSSEQQIPLKVKIIDSFRESKPQNKIYKIIANQNVNELVLQIKNEYEETLALETERPFFFLLESSRILEKEKTFAEQDISKDTEILCLITKHELKTRFSNDTKEEILHDISELLGFEDEVPEKREPPKKEERTQRSRYPREERRNSDTHERFKTVQNRKINQAPQPQPEEQDVSLNKTASYNFKKKKGALSRTYSINGPERPLATKLKASKSRKEIELLLKSQERPGNIFETPEVIKEAVKEQSKKEGEEDTDMEIHKPAPSIPKVMPVKERRKIRLEIEKLFDLGDATEPLNQIPEVKEQEKPKSPPTEQPSRPPQKQKQRMRFSMGSRPAFLDQLKLSQK